LIDKRYALGKVFSVGSSSEGNSYFLEINRKDYPTPFRLLIECGFSYGELEQRLQKQNVSIKDIDAILVSHEHQDHSKAVETLVNYGKKVYAPYEVFERYNVLNKVTEKNILKNKKVKIIVDGIRVLPMLLDHKNSDGSDVVNFGYIIEIDSDYGIHRILFATDTHFIRYNLKPYKFHTIFIEANNRAYVIKHAMKEEEENHGKSFKYYHFDRVLHSHMLVENTVKTLIGSKETDGFDLSETDTIYLIHMSANALVSHNNIKYYVIEALEKANTFRNITRNNKNYKMPTIKIFRKNGEMM